MFIHLKLHTSLFDSFLFQQASQCGPDVFAFSLGTKKAETRTPSLVDQVELTLMLHYNKRLQR